MFHRFLTLLQENFFIPKLAGLFKGNRNGYTPTTEPLLAGEDNDVTAERKKVLSGGTDERDVVIIKNLVKVRDHLSLAILLKTFCAAILDLLRAAEWVQLEASQASCEGH